MPNNTLATQKTCSIRVRRLLALALVICLMAVLLVAPAADTATAFSTIGDKLTGLFKAGYNLILKLTLPAAVVVLSWAAIQMFLGGQRNMEEAKKKCFVVVGVVLIVWTAPVIVKELADAFSGNTAWNFTIPTVS